MPKQKYKKPLSFYETLYGRGRTTIEAWSKLDMPLDDEDYMREFMASQRSGKEGDEPADIKEAKLRKLVLECDRLQLKLDEERKALIPFATVDAWLSQIAAAVDSAFDSIIAEVPTWTGYTPAKAQAEAKAIKKRLTAAFHAAPRKLLNS